VRIVNRQQTIIPPASGQRPFALYARRASDSVVRAPSAPARDDEAADAKPGRGQLVDILV
jgi:hypothetical protein